MENHLRGRLNQPSLLAILLSPLEAYFLLQRHVSGALRGWKGLVYADNIHQGSPL